MLKLTESFERSEKMMAKKLTPEELAREKALDREARERLAESIDRYERWMLENARRRARLNRLTLGLLGRH
jgi:hypothetical protein